MIHHPQQVLYYFVVVALFSNCVTRIEAFSRLGIRKHSQTAYLHAEFNNEEECILDDDDASRLSNCLQRTGYEATESITATIFKAALEKLSDRVESANVPNQRVITPTSKSFNIHYSSLLDDDDVVLVDVVRNNKKLPLTTRALVRGGPRAQLHFQPQNVRAAVITCGGLCPGLNTVIRELTHALYDMYGVKTVYGVRGGYHGFGEEPVVLTTEMVEDIHHQGGTILRTSRGGFDIEKIIDFLTKYDIQQLYVIGGDGTHRGAYAVHQELVRRNLNIAVAGIPKTIDNDVDYIDRSFGFLTAVEAAQASIRTAKTEAMCVMPNGVTVVKLMGRSAGFLAATSALGSVDVDAVLVPEVPIVLDGPDGILPFIYKRTKEKQYAVVVVAEGAGEEILGKSSEVDKGGNRKLPPIGEFIRDQIKDYFTSKGEESVVRYIDPSYTVRSVPSNAADTIYCTDLAHSAVHGAMAGYTGFSAGLVNNKICYLPIPLLVASSPRNMDANGVMWERVLEMTGQPNPRTVVTNGSTMDELQLPDPHIY